MKWIPFSLSLIICLFFCSNIIAQQKHLHKDIPLTKGPDGFVRCASMEVDAIRRLNNPNIQSVEDFEKWLAPKVQDYKEKKASDKSVNIITIPLVVHVLHNGEPIGTAPNITDAQVLSQVQVLNEDFRKILNSNGWNNHPDGADVEIEFCPASTDPWGKPTNGVNHINIQQDGATRDDLEGTIKPSTIWDPNQYMNMWSVKFAAPDDNLLGYAQFPEGSGLEGMPVSGEDPTTDGVVIRFEAFGTIDQDDGTFILMNNYNLGRTATHEVGHWVGLRHVWGDGLGCNLPVVPPGCSCQVDDYCDDTPNQEGANYGCPEGKTSLCAVPATLDMKENYMDYSDDVCMNIFTNDQKARVQAVMANSPRRMELGTSPACAPPSPYISFASTNSTVTEGTSCDMKTINVEVKISQSATQSATVHYSVNGTATDGVDFIVSPATLSFPAGSTASQYITISIQEDAVVEASEFISLEIESVNTSGNALKALTDYRSMLVILNDDFAPENAGSNPQILLFSENFNTLGLDWTVVNGTGSAVEWNVGAPPLGLAGNYNAFISPVDLPVALYLYNPNAIGYSSMESPSINAAHATKLELTFTYTCFGEEGYDFGTLWYSKNGGDWEQFGPAEISGQPIPTTIAVPLPVEAENATDLRIAFRWANDELLGGHPPFSFDDIELRATAGAPAGVETEISTGDGDEKYIGPYATVHFFDPSTGKVMATIQNNSDYDFGCSTLEVDRSVNSVGNSAILFWNNNPTNALASKTFYLQTTNNEPPSGVTITTSFYYTDNELSGWESATQQSSNDIEMVCIDGHTIAAVTPSNGGDYDVVIATTDLNNYSGANSTVTATIPAISGGLGVGVPGTPLATELGNGSGQSNILMSNGMAELRKMTLYPNPATAQFEVVLKLNDEETAKVEIRNQFGQIVMEQKVESTNRVVFDSSELPSGIYLVSAMHGSMRLTEKLIVQ